MNKILQKQFFDQKEHQYKQDLIIDPPTHTKLEVEKIIKRLPKDKNLTIVDFGCGSGRLTIPLLQKGYEVWAIDISSQSLLELKKLASNLFKDNKTKAKLKVSTFFPTDMKFRLVTGADILHHIDLDQQLPILQKALKRNGRIIFSEPGGFNLSWYLYLPLFHNWTIEKRVTHCTYFNLIKKLRQHGFRRIKIAGLGLLPRPLFNFSKTLCNLNDKLGDLPFLKYFAYRYIIEAMRV